MTEQEYIAAYAYRYAVHIAGATSMAHYRPTLAMLESKLEAVVKACGGKDRAAEVLALVPPEIVTDARAQVRAIRNTE